MVVYRWCFAYTVVVGGCIHTIVGGGFAYTVVVGGCVHTIVGGGFAYSSSRYIRWWFSIYSSSS